MRTPYLLAAAVVVIVAAVLGWLIQTDAPVHETTMTSSPRAA